MLLKYKVGNSYVSFSAKFLQSASTLTLRDESLQGFRIQICWFLDLCWVSQLPVPIAVVIWWWGTSITVAIKQSPAAHFIYVFELPWAGNSFVTTHPSSHTSNSFCATLSLLSISPFPLLHLHKTELQSVLCCKISKTSFKMPAHNFTLYCDVKINFTITNKGWHCDCEAKGVSSAWRVFKAETNFLNFFEITVHVFAAQMVIP